MKKLLILFLMLISCSFANEIDDKISQMIIIGFDGNSVKSRGFKRVEKQLKNNLISGVILFSKNIKSKEDLIEMTTSLKSSSNTLPFIAIDNEGGMVQRYNFEQYETSVDVAKKGSAFAHKQYSKMAKLEKELGINLNFAPVVDLNINKNSIIAKKQRSFSSDPKVVAKYAKIFIDEHNKYKVMTSLKHFPGHGAVTGDTHKGFVDATNTFSNDELKPYYALNKENTTVMVSHIYNSKFDNRNPASLSKKTIDYLKNDIGFNGVIISDDYDMGAIRDNYSLKDIVVNSINSGINIMIFSNNLNYKDKNIAKKVRKIVKSEIKKGNIKEADIEKSYEKIVKLKATLK